MAPSPMPPTPIAAPIAWEPIAEAAAPWADIADPIAAPAKPAPASLAAIAPLATDPIAAPGSIPVPIAADTCPKFIPPSIGPISPNVPSIPSGFAPGPIISPSLAPSGPAAIPILAAISGFISAFKSILPIPTIPPLIAANPMSPPSIPIAPLKPSIPFAPIAAIVPWLTKPTSIMSPIIPADISPPFAMLAIPWTALLPIPATLDDITEVISIPAIPAAPMLATIPGVIPVWAAISAIPNLSIVPTSIPVIPDMACPISALPIPPITPVIPVIPCGDAALSPNTFPIAAAVIPSGGAIAPGKPPANEGFAIIIAPIIIPDSLILSGISRAWGPVSPIFAANESFISAPWAIAFFALGAFPEIAWLIIPTVPDIAPAIPTSGFANAVDKLFAIFSIPISAMAFPISFIPSIPFIPSAIPAMPCIPMLPSMLFIMSSPMPLALIVATIAPVMVWPILPIASGFAANVSNAAVAAPTGKASKAPAIIAGFIPISATFIEAKPAGSKAPISKVSAPITDFMSTIPDVANPFMAVPIPIPWLSKAPIIPLESKPAFSTALIWPANFCIATTFPAPICPAILDNAAISSGENSFPKSIPPISRAFGSGIAPNAISVTPSTIDIAWTAEVMSPLAKLSCAKAIAVSAWAIDVSNAFPISDFASPRAPAAPAIFAATFPASLANWSAAACAELPAASEISDIAPISFALTNWWENNINKNIILNTIFLNIIWLSLFVFEPLLLQLFEH